MKTLGYVFSYKESKKVGDQYRVSFISGVSPISVAAKHRRKKDFDEEVIHEGSYSRLVPEEEALIAEYHKTVQELAMDEPFNHYRDTVYPKYKYRLRTPMEYEMWLRYYAACHTVWVYAGITIPVATLFYGDLFTRLGLDYDIIEQFDGISRDIYHHDIEAALGH